jgi:replicative DNA helicase
MIARIEVTILRSLLKDEDFARKVLPFIKPDYFRSESDKVVYATIHEFYTKYDKAPTPDALIIGIDANKKLTEKVHLDAKNLVTQFGTDPLPVHQWLLDNTEAFCKEKALYNAMTESISIMEGDTKTKKTTGSIPQMVTEALSISFDPRVGHDYIEDADARYDYYHRIEAKLPFTLDTLNRVTNGGITDKTLNVLMGGIHVGKTALLCALTASYLLQGKNVLYITLEMSEEEIAKRIDANLLNAPMDDVVTLPKQVFQQRIAGVKQKIGQGALKIEEYPTGGSANVLHFRALLNELYLKKNFKPDVIVIDYLNNCGSSRIKLGGSINLYSYIKAIAEEIRGLAIETNTRIWSATQFNRDGMKTSDPSMTDTSESIGLPAVVDLLWMLVRSEELDNLGQIQVSQAKNRYRDITKDPKFIIGFDRPKMRIYDVGQSAQPIATKQPLVNMGTPPSSKPGTKPKIGPSATAEWKIN